MCCITNHNNHHKYSHISILKGIIIEWIYVCTVTYTHYTATIQSQFEKDVNRSLAYYFNGNLIYIRTSVCTVLLIVKMSHLVHI